MLFFKKKLEYINSIFIKLLQFIDFTSKLDPFLKTGPKSSGGLFVRNQALRTFSNR